MNARSLKTFENIFLVLVNMEIESRGENKVFLFETFCEIPFILSNGFDFGLKLMLRCLYGIIRSLAMHILLCDEKLRSGSNIDHRGGLE